MDVYVTKTELQEAKLDDAAPLTRVSFQMGKDPIAGRTVAIRLKLIDEEKETAA